MMSLQIGKVNYGGILKAKSETLHWKQGRLLISRESSLLIIGKEYKWILV